MPFLIVRNDITEIDTDAIVNAANTSLRPGGGVCGAIFAAAGYDLMKEACERIGHCETGNAVITDGFKLKARYVIHTPGPYYQDGQHGEEEKLYSCYKSALGLAKKYGLGSIAFPLISSGIYGYTKKQALCVATKAIMDFLADNEMDIYLVVYDKCSFEVSSKLFSEIKIYMDESLSETAYLYNETCRNRRYSSDEMMPEPVHMSYGAPMAPMPDFRSLFRKMDKSFSEYLIELIDRRGMKDSDVYKRANIDRKHFSKIRNNPQYKPKKTTAVAFAIALELDLSDTRELIGRAGFTLSHSSKFDIIIEYFIKHKEYNVFEINEVLFEFDQPLIGG